MAKGPWGATFRVAAIIAGVVLPMTVIGIVRAELPGLPSPPVGGLPQGGQPITFVIEPPGTGTDGVPVAPNGCVLDMSYDNTQATPPGTVFRGQTACGWEFYQPTISGHAYLTDIFGNVVASAPGFGARGDGPFTSQGSYVVNPSASAVTSPSTYGAGPVPGMEYTITYTTTIVLYPGQIWGPASDGCSVSGQAMTCTASTTYLYVPGTSGGVTPG